MKILLPNSKLILRINNGCCYEIKKIKMNLYLKVIRLSKQITSILKKYVNKKVIEKKINDWKDQKMIKNTSSKNSFHCLDS